MEKYAVSSRQEQAKVNAYFQSQSSFWKNIYASDGVFGEIYRERQAAALAWIESLALPPGSRVLEIGCGAGFMSIALAQRGLRVHSIDSVEAMVEQARRHVSEAGMADLSVEVGDVYNLSFEDETFDLVVALGVLPWLEQPKLAVQEMARVVKPEGHLLVTADNRARLTMLLDPLMSPALAPVRRSMKGALEKGGFRRREPEAPVFHQFHDCAFIDEALTSAELMKLRGITLGFGPFSLFRRKVFPESLSVALHARLQYLADRGVPGFRSSGAQYLVLARKSPSRSSLDFKENQEPVLGTADVV